MIDLMDLGLALTSGVKEETIRNLFKEPEDFVMEKGIEIAKENFFKESDVSMKTLFLSPDEAEGIVNGIISLYKDVSGGGTPIMGHVSIEKMNREIEEATDSLLSEDGKKFVKRAGEELKEQSPMEYVSMDSTAIYAGEMQRGATSIIISCSKTYTGNDNVISLLLSCYQQKTDIINPLDTPIAQFQMAFTDDYQHVTSYPMIVWNEESNLSIILMLMDALLSKVDLKGLFDSVGESLKVYTPDFEDKYL